MIPELEERISQLYQQPATAEGVDRAAGAVFAVGN